MGKRGTIESVIYFINGNDPNHAPGFVMLAPYTECPTPSGYTREGASTLAEVDKLCRILVSQETRDHEDQLIHDEVLRERATESSRDRLRQRMMSSAATPYERDYLAAWFALKDEQKRKRYADAFDHRVMYLHAREFDTPKDRPVDSERVNLDRIG